jgi:molybdenum cofactor cytidylyltransferase
MIAGLVLAAGAGRRFGGAKQLADLDGRPLLEHVLAAMEDAPVDRVLVVLGARAEEILTRVHLGRAEPVRCQAWPEGQSASLRCGLEAAGDAGAVVVALGDQPRLSPVAVRRLVAARAPGIEAVRATYDGVPGHPVLLEPPLFPRLRAVRGDTGARDVLAAARLREVACDGLGAPTDVDTPDQLAALGAPAVPEEHP